MSEQKIDRKVFLAWTLTAAGAAVLGCSDDGGGGDDNVGGGGDGSGGTTGGTGGSTGGTGGTAGMNTSGSGGVGGTGGSGGSIGGNGGVGGQGGDGGEQVGGNGGTGGGAGSGGDGNNPNADCEATINVTITANHMHTLEISLADITAAATKAYETGGAAPHTHWVEITAEDFLALQSGATVRKISCDDQHEHEYIIQCFADEPTQTPGVFGVCFEPTGMDCGDEDGHFCPPVEG